MRQFVLVTAAIAAVSTAVPACADTLISENFDSGLGVFTATGQVGINTGNGYVPCCSTTGSVANMSNPFVAFGSGDQPSGTISTSFNTVAGELYYLSFDYGTLGSGIDELSLSIPEYAISFGFDAVATDNLDFTFNPAAIQILGNGSQLTLRFSSAGTASADAVLDNVVLTGPAAAVPEPATWAMMLVGFGAMAFAMRRKKQSQAALS